MSFGKAKRFNYRCAEALPSPADYVICSQFDRGCRISRSARFFNSLNGDGTTFIMCPRMCHYHTERCSTPNSEEEDYARNFDILKKKILEFNRNDMKRQSVKRKSLRKESSGKQTNNKSHIRGNPDTEHPKDATPLYESEEYFDDDYESFTSSEELDSLKKMEEYEFNEVCKAFQRLQAKDSFKKQKRGSCFEETVLHKLEKIDNNVEDFKDDLETLRQNVFSEQSEVHLGKPKELKRNNMGYYVYEYNPVEAKQSEIQRKVTEAIEALRDEFEKDRKYILSENKTKINKLKNEMQTSNEQSAVQIKKICKETAEKLSTDLSSLIENNAEYTSELEYACGIQHVSLAEEAKEQSQEFNEVKILEESKESEDVNEVLDDMLEDITLKYSGTEHMLDVQGAIIEVLKDELADLKQSLYRKK